jgi:hypothetical protein
MRHIGIFLVPEFEELDIVGPWEVLANWTRAFPDDGYGVCCLSRPRLRGRELRSSRTQQQSASTLAAEAPAASHSLSGGRPDSA